MAKRRSFSAAFKAKVALEAFAGEAALAELSARHKVHLVTSHKVSLANHHGLWLAAFTGGIP